MTVFRSIPGDLQRLVRNGGQIASDCHCKHITIMRTKILLMEHNCVLYTFIMIKLTHVFGDFRLSLWKNREIRAFRKMTVRFFSVFMPVMTSRGQCYTVSLQGVHVPMHMLTSIAQ